MGRDAEILENRIEVMVPILMHIKQNPRLKNGGFAFC
jgi:hypothetical protein